MSSPSSRLPGIAALLFATASWGSLFLVGKGVLQHVAPVWLTLIRYTLSALVFAALLGLRGSGGWHKLRQHAVPLALHGFAGFGVFSILLFVGLSHSVPSHGAVLIATTPITTQLLRWWLDGVRPTRTTLLTAALALAGVATVAGLLSPGGAGLSHDTLLGDAIAFVGTLGWVVYTRGAARFPTLDTVDYTALTVLASWPLLLAVAVGMTALGASPAPNAQGLRLSWQVLLYVGLVPSALAVLAFNHGVRALGAVTGTAFLNFVPVSALLMGVALGKPPATHEIVGVAMVVVALLLHVAAAKRAATPGAALPGAAPGARACGVTPRTPPRPRPAPEDRVVAVRHPHEHLAHVQPRLQVGDGAPAVEQRGPADDLAFEHGLEVVHLDLDGGADLGRLERGVQGRAHARVGPRIQHGAVHHLVRVQVLRRDDQRHGAGAGGGLLAAQVDQIGEGMFHGDGK